MDILCFSDDAEKIIGNGKYLAPEHDPLREGSSRERREMVCNYNYFSQLSQYQICILLHDRQTCQLDLG